ncbi:hypothetical protein CANCADRAFT_31164 [Tortispora caseinolytica NRRL Y-17796]|uniref:HDA1 complex subunit n=1 Tax=Tortispora caseinolytica NRRL Y-17796 TaxID=767744 RepID=A0A1E4TEH1_9ASCO|nr:hypothetical protein CANCADRAFT_31164 [Tortispora caseinolytica NRRL Y-17796]
MSSPEPEEDASSTPALAVSTSEDDTKPQAKVTLGIIHHHDAGSQTAPSTEVDNVLRKYLSVEEDYDLPVPFSDIQIKATDAVIIGQSSDISRFCANDRNDRDSLVPNMRSVLKKALQIAVHPYIVLDYLFPSGPRLRDKSEMPYIAETSGKYKSFMILVTALSKTPAKVAVIIQPGKASDILDGYLTARRMRFTRITSEIMPSEPKENLLLFSSDPADYPNLDKLELEPVDLIIGFDSTFDPASPQVKTLRGSKPAPIARLVSPYSVEHILLTAARLSNGEMNAAILNGIISTMVILSQRAGAIPPEYVGITYEKIAKRLSDWVIDPNPNKLWPFAELATIDELASSDTSIAPVDQELPSVDSKHLVSDLFRLAEGAMTRAADELGRPPRKKIKVEEHSESAEITPNGIRLPSMNIDYILDKDIDVSKENEKLIKAIQVLEDMYEANFNSLKSEIAELKKEKSELVTSLDKHKVELTRAYNDEAKRRDDLKELILSIDSYKERTDRAEKRAERVEHDNESLLRANEELKSRVDELKKLLETESPGASEIASLKDALTMAEKEVSRLKAKLEDSAKDNEYARDQYQKASSTAADAQNTVNELQRQIEELKRKSDGEALKLRNLQFAEERSAREEYIRKVELQLSSLEEQLRRQEEENKGTRGRHTSRNSSNNRRKQSPANGHTNHAKFRMTGSNSNSQANGSSGTKPAPHPLQNVVSSQ